MPLAAAFLCLALVCMLIARRTTWFERLALLVSRQAWLAPSEPSSQAEDPQQALEHVVDEILSETSNQKAARGVSAPEASGRQAPRPLGKAAGRYASVGAELDLD